MHSLKLQSLDKRIVFISNQFLGKPYLPGALGEGEEGQFDETPLYQTPLYRTDYFDCLTLVNTVCALPYP
ncbi:N-acetylmuramoyl-L-alanine amidase-like domain-containing protein [Candidatus Coxiella mudrowiae]|uniref:N-acetylmuramoyl-L-alanine amidase-like domain-containing protein n=1 Tax=Candidatus Coxiella mudrowiae TaxID=2054173 RepID=UPI00066201B1|nr:N-acetylmuramoyl-L-alanine amidase-like domain-containing protein [Candidatus Coxiella mudrowiae]